MGKAKKDPSLMTEVDAVKANPELELVAVEADGEWRSVVARRK